MSQNIGIELHLLVLSILTGVCLMAVYDMLRVLRLFIPHGWGLIGAEDFLYWIGCGLATFYLLYRENDGGLRMYVIGSVLASMVVYDRLCSRFFLKLLKNAGRWIKMKLRKPKGRRT